MVDIVFYTDFLSEALTVYDKPGVNEFSKYKAQFFFQ